MSGNQLVDLHHFMKTPETEPLHQRMGRHGLAMARGQLLLSQWAKLNGVTRGHAPFAPETLAAGKAHAAGRGYTRWPGRDHEDYFKRNGRAIAIVTQPYELSKVEELREHAEGLGLSIQMPPVPVAGTYFPGFAYFAVITRDDFGPVRWLPDQLSFVMPDLSA